MHVRPSLPDRSLQRCFAAAPWSRWTPTIAIFLVALTTICIYFPGLHGPFLLDDPGNLEPLDRWFHGELGWRAVVLDNRSGPTGRPLSMLSFLLDVARTGNLDSFTFKPTNLAIHIISGLLVFLLAREILGTGDWGQPFCRWVPVAVMTLWLWLPIQVSTVLYVIQRMAQLSALWTLATLVLYLHIRRRVALTPSWRNILSLWVLVPASAALATLSKENGALALPLVAVAEWTLFAGSVRPRPIKVFIAITFGIPAIIAVVYFSFHTNFFSRGYVARDFTLTERLLTEPRILWNYLATSFVPEGSNMGIYHDNYIVSKGLFSPWSTGASIAAWMGITAWALYWRRTQPLFAFGVLAYLVAHLLESGPIALELYFEHRNYLPSAFAIVAGCGLLRYLMARREFTRTFRVAGVIAITAVAAIYGLSSWNHATAWSSEEEFHALQYEYNPTSPRLLSVLAGQAIVKKDLPEALRFIGEGELYSDASERGTSTIWRLIAYCEANIPVPTTLYNELEQRAHGRITNFAMVGWDLLADRAARGCDAMDAGRIAGFASGWLETSGQPDTAQPVWRTRYNAGRILATTGDVKGAETMIRRAWLDSDHNNGVGVLLFQLDASLGKLDRCREVLSQLERVAGGDDKRLNEAIRTFRDAIANGEIVDKPDTNP